MTYRTPDQVAAEFIAEGRRLDVAPRGIVICIATGLVESNLTVYANRADPASMNEPHDAVGSDANSVGPLQQRAPWWGTSARERMDPTLSSRLFYAELVKLPYATATTDAAAGRIAQQVQQSAYPDRYATRMGEAQRIYDRLATTAAPNPAPTTGGAPMPDYGITKVMHGYNADSAGIGNSNGPRTRTPYLVWHTQQAKSTAVNLATFCINSAEGPNPVAYNFAVDGRDTVEIVPVGEGPWAAAAANDIGVHVCFAGSFAEWTRNQWLDDGDDSGDGLSESLALDRGARIAVAVNQQFGVPLTYVGDGGRSGWPVKASGNVGHRDFGQRGGGHTDPGDGFPMDELLRRAQALLTPAPNLIDIAAKVAANWLGKRITQGEGNTRPAGSGKVALFENGAIYYKQGAPAAIPVPKGGLFEAYAALDYEAGPLGFPARGHTVLPDGGVQAFEGGVLFRKNDSERGAYVTGAIGKRYAATGWEAGPWGWPITNETDGPDGTRIQSFEHVTATWSPDGVVTIGKDA
ncbi:Endolysin [Tsukamurella ocularis]|uniref:hypothetical protein n=1 Tax=Tsukamurella ocularis TaxID=1970234 RepID=UPI0039EE53A1